MGVNDHASARDALPEGLHFVDLPLDLFAVDLAYVPLIKLLDLYGDDVFAAAVADVVTRGLGDLGALGMACEKHRKDRRRPLPVELVLPDHLDDTEVVPCGLETYDE